MLRSMMSGGKMEYMEGGKVYEEGGSIENSLSKFNNDELAALYQMLLNRQRG